MTGMTAMRRAGSLLAALLLAGCSVMGGKAAEEPGFELVERDGPFEIRDYGALAVARTTVEAESRDAAVREGFGRLFDYITGANRAEAEISMTAPVLTNPSGESEAGGERISMTAPVLSSETSSGWETIFVLPDDMTAESAPVPTSPEVTIGEIPARRVAVATFAGLLGAEAIARERRALDGWLDARGLEHEGDWQAAGYNPPWTIPALRRNEVMVTLAGGDG